MSPIMGLRSAPILWPNRGRVSVHSSGIDKFLAELINRASRVLTLIVQQLVFRVVLRISTMIVEVRTLIGPISIIEHKRVHCDHDAVLGAATRCGWIDGVIEKCDCMIVKVRPARAVRLLVTLDFPAPRARLKQKADAALEEMT